METGQGSCWGGGEAWGGGAAAGQPQTLKWLQHVLSIGAKSNSIFFFFLKSGELVNLV